MSIIKKKKIANNKKNTKNLKKEYKQKIKRNKIIGLFFGLISIGIILYASIFVFNYVSNLKLSVPDIKLDKNITNITENSGTKITEHPKKKSIDILLLGHGGGNHEAPLLTDTIILVKVNFQKNFISMLSIPRDLYVEYNEEKSCKINELYMRDYYKYHENKQKAVEKIMKKVSQITGEKINYYVNVDFNGFIKIIDSIGGIKITLKKTFIDYKYPTNNRGYTTFILKKGTWVLDGKTALKYARSRHSTSDFDRSLRQQQIINAVKNKILSLGFLTSPSKMKKLYDTVKANIDTNLSANDMISLLIFSKNIQKSDIYTSNLNDSCYYGSDKCMKGGFLYLPLRADFNNQSVLLPYGATKDNLNNYSLIQKYSNIIFNYPEIFKEKYQINIFNSTKRPGLATSYAEYLRRFGFNIPYYNSVGNVKNKIFKETKIYFNNIDKNSVTLKALKKFIFGPQIKIDSPKYSKDKNTKIEIVIGKDYKYLDN